MRLKRVIDESNVFRDEKSNAIVVDDKASFEKYMNEKRSRTSLKKLESRIDSIEGILQQILRKLNV